MRFKKHLEPPPKNMIGPRVMCLAKLIRQANNKATAKQGVFSGQHDIILHLVENEGMTLSELANTIEVSNATASVSVKRMEKAGFIQKKADKNDARIIRLYPTEKAKTIPDNIKQMFDSLEAKLKQNMTEEQAAELAELLETAINNLSKGGIDRC